MSRARRIASAPWRLAMAMRRNGVRPVARFIVLTLRRRGLTGSLRLAVADRMSRGIDAKSDVEPDLEPDVVDTPRQASPADLDATYAMTPQAWAGWETWIGAPAVSSDPYDEAFEPADVAYVLRSSDGADAPPRPPAAAPDAEVGGRRPGRWLVFLKRGDKPMPWLARELARAALGGVAQVVSFDMVRRTDAGDVQPLLFPGVNPTLYRAVDHLFGRIAVRADLLPAGQPPERVDPRALVLDWLGRQPPLQARGRWRHVGRPVVEAAITDADVAAQQTAARALNTSRLAPSTRAGVGGATVVICTRDRGHLTRQLVRGLLSQPRAQIAEVIIVANGTSNPYALAALRDLAGDPRVRVLRRDEPFNFSKLCNAGVAAGAGDGPLLFLNDDIAPVSEDWLARLRARLDAAPETGAVGPLLLYPDERVQQAGMFLGFDAGAGHTLRGARPGEDDYLLYLTAPREVSCLTGAALLTRREAFLALGGFDVQLATLLQDVDYGLRLSGAGWTSVFEPAAVLLHMESTSLRGLERSAAFHRMRHAEIGRFVARWGPTLKRDPLHPAGFDVGDETLRRLSAADGGRPPSRDGAGG